MAVSVLALVGAACSGGDGPSKAAARPTTTTTTAPPTTTTAPPPTSTTAPRPRASRRAPAALVRFTACEELLGHLRSEALKIVGPWGLAHYGTAVAVSGATAARSAAGRPAEGGDSAGAAPAAAPAYSGTNVQEAGVDEPDLVKTDGRRVFAVAQQRLYAMVVKDGVPSLAGSLQLEGWQADLLLAGDRIVVLGTKYDESKVHAFATVIDVGDPAAMQVVARLTVDGSYLSARLVDGVARIVVQAQGQGPAMTSPKDGSAAAQTAAIAHNKAAVQRSTLADWLPRYTLEDRRGAQPKVSEGLACACEQTYRPQQFSGTGNLSVLTLDPADPRPGKAASVVADGNIVYASAKGLYVGTNRWADLVATTTRDPASPASQVRTQVHKFDITGRTEARYLASGEVAGYALNQFSLSEHAGHLRVATTSSPPWAGIQGLSESSVSVLAQQGDRLGVVGQVGGLGRGERIYSVRFLGDRGYVVTFRQVDPLYVLDLADPRRPQVKGELKILGYSAYLHPTDPNLLLGVGVDASEEGRRLGTQVSLFDVANPAAPTRRHQHRLGQGSTEVEHDHHAFLYWAPSRLAVVPVVQHQQQPQQSQDGTYSSAFLGVVALRVDPAAGFSEAARLSHARQGSDYGAAIRRSLVIGDGLYTMSERGLMASDLSTFAERGWVPFPASASPSSPR